MLMQYEKTAFASMLSQNTSTASFKQHSASLVLRHLSLVNQFPSCHTFLLSA